MLAAMAAPSRCCNNRPSAGLDTISGMPPTRDATTGVPLGVRARLSAPSGLGPVGNNALAVGDADPDGPTTHINTFGLTTDDADDMSTTVPRLRRDDAL